MPAQGQETEGGRPLPPPPQLLQLIQYFAKLLKNSGTNCQKVVLNGTSVLKVYINIEFTLKCRTLYI